MNKKPEQKQNRREILTGTLRYISLGALGIFAGKASSNRKKLLRENKCIDNLPKVAGCRDCRILADCRLPLGLSAKQVLLKKV